MAETKIKRRYVDQKKPEFKIYNEAFDRYLMDSQILNSGNTRVNAYTKIFDKQGIIAELYELEGDEEGKYTKWDHTREMASIPYWKNKLKRINSQFKDYCDRREAHGYKRPTKEPEDLFIKRLKAEARLDTYLREREFLLQHLEEQETKEEEVQSKNILKYGPRGNARLSGGEIVEIDGQRCGRTKKDILVILEKGSPYVGCKVSDYRQYVVEPFAQQRTNRTRELVQRRAKEINQKGASNIIIPLSVKTIDKGSLPPFPAGCKNYLIETLNDEEEES